MKKYMTWMLCILTLLLSVGMFAACREEAPPVTTPDPTPLAAPVGFSVADDVLSWTPVEGAVSYLVTCEGEKYTTETASLDIFCIADRPGVKFSFTVTAKGDGQTTLDSPASEPYEYSFRASSDGIGYVLASDGVTYLAKAEDPEKLVGKIYIPGEYDGYLVTGITNEGFKDCTGITGVVMHNNIELLGVSAFEGCTELTRISLPWTVNLIDYSAFKGCAKLSYVQLPESLSAIAFQAFEGCTSLTSLTVSPKNRNFKADLNCLYKRNGELVLYAGGASGVLPSEVTVIGQQVFMNSPLERIVLHEGIEEIKLGAFANSALKELTFPASLIEIGEQAFVGCTSLERIVITKGISAIGKRAFYGCTAATFISIPGTVDSIGDEAFGALADAVVMLSGDVHQLGGYVFSGANVSVYTDWQADGDEPAWPFNWGLAPEKTQDGWISSPGAPWKYPTVRYFANCTLKTDDNGALYVTKGTICFREVGLNEAAPESGVQYYNEKIEGLYVVGVIDSDAGMLAPVREGYTFLGWSTTEGGEINLPVRQVESTVEGTDGGESTTVTRDITLISEEIDLIRFGEDVVLYAIYQKNA